ncbi:MAG: PAS domain S-box protein [Ignavibacteria bacterium]|nr:PAS domain S-box protein [Ignavibacteria bacterium]
MVKKNKSEIKSNTTLPKKGKTDSQSKLDSNTPNISSSEDYQLLNIIFDNVKLNVALIDKLGRLIKVNNSLLNTFSYSLEEILKLKYTDLSHPDDKDISIKLFKEIMSGKRNSYEITKRYLSKNGEVIWGRVNVSAVKNKENKIQFFVAIGQNITEQIKKEAEYEFERNLFNQLLENSTDTVYFKDKNSRFIKVNKSFLRKHGFKSFNEIIGKTDFDFFGKEHSQQAFDDEQKIMKTGQSIINKEEKEDHHDGRVSFVLSSKHPLYDAYKNIIGIFGISKDITDRKLLQIRYQSLYENSVDGIFIMTDLFEDCNSAVCNLFACEKEDIIGRSPVDFSPKYQPDGRLSSESAKEKLEAVFKGIPQRFYWKHLRKDGVLIDCEVALQSINLNNRNLVQATVRDITDKMRAEKLQKAIYQISEAAMESEDIDKLYQSIHEIIGELMSAKNFYIALYDVNNDLLTFPYFVDEFDPPQPPKKLGRGLTEYVIKKGEAILVDAKLDLELRERGEVDLIGEPQAIWLGIPLKLAEKIIGVLVVQDYNDEFAYGEEEKQLLIFVSEQISQAITRKKNAEAIKKYAQELHQSNSTKDKFFSIIAHDLKNPFITILGFSDLLHSDYNELSDEERLFYIEEMRKSADISHALLQNLLQWSRSQTGRIDFNPQKLSLAKIINDNAELLMPTAQNKEIKIHYNIDPKIYVFADEDMSYTVVRNLISNAIKFTNKDGLVKIYSDVNHDFVTITVEDTGIGMDESVRQNLFMLDQTHSTPGTNNEAGTGLGLLLCKEFVEKNGGTITVESIKGKGSKFIFSLPVAI